MNYKNKGEQIKSTRELEFAVFCIENVAKKLQKSSGFIYKLWTEKSDILYQYIIPCYDVLHTQGKEYIVNDILEVMAERGIKV